MSRIGKMPVVVPNGVTVTLTEHNFITVKGPKGQLERTLVPDMKIVYENNEITVTRPNDLKRNR